MQRTILLSIILGYITLVSAQPTLQWAKSMGAFSGDVPNSIAVDALGNVYTTGYFNGTVDFDPGPGVANLTSASISGNIFVQKLDAAGNYVWAKRMGGSGFCYGNSIALDPSSNVYTIGNFDGTADFDPGAGTANLTSAGGLYDIFISKLDVSGNYIWARRMGGTDIDVGNSIAVDASENVYTTGFFKLTVDFDPGGGTANLTAAGAQDVYIQKLDVSGNFVWVKQMGGIALDYGNSITLDASNNVYTVGVFSDVVDFDPNAGTMNLTSGGSYDAFVQKLDASGNYIWAKRMGGTGIAWGNSIAVDGAGSVYTTGKFTGTGDFDPGAATTNLISEGAYDIYISKLDVSGNFSWAQRVGSTLSEYANSIALDASGNIFIMGDMYSSITDFDPGPSVYNLTNIGTEAVFAAQYDNDGNFLCALMLGPGHNETYRNRHIALLGSDMYMVYSFDDASVDVNHCPPVVNLPYVGNSDIAVAKYDMSICPCNIFLAANTISFSAERSVKYVYTEWDIAYTDNLISYEVLRSADGVEYTALGVMNTDKMSFTDMEALSVLAYYKLRIINQQGNSIFSDVVSVQPRENSVITEIYPNPMSQQTTLEFDNSRKENHTLTLFNAQGQLVRAITDIKTGRIEIKRKKLTSGLYFFQLRTDTHLFAMGKLMLQ